MLVNEIIPKDRYAVNFQIIHFLPESTIECFEATQKETEEFTSRYLSASKNAAIDKAIDLLRSLKNGE